MITRTMFLPIVLLAAIAQAEPSNGFFGNYYLVDGKIIPRAAVAIKGGDSAALLDEDVTTVQCLPFDRDRPITVSFRFEKARLFKGLRLVGLHAKSLENAREHGRVESVVIKTEGGSAEFDLRDRYLSAVASPEPRVEGRPATDEGEPPPILRLRSAQTLQVGRGPSAKAARLEPVPTKTVDLEIKGIQPGTKYQDVCIASIQLLEP